MSTCGGRGWGDRKSFPSISSEWGILSLLEVMPELTEVCAGNLLWYLLGTWSHIKVYLWRSASAFHVIPFMHLLWFSNLCRGPWLSLLLVLVPGFVFHSATYLFSLVPQSHLQFTQSINDADCRHYAAVGASHSKGILSVRTGTCHQTTVPCTGIDSDDRKIHCISKNIQFPIEDNMTLTCFIIFKGWDTHIANNLYLILGYIL